MVTLDRIRLTGLLLEPRFGGALSWLTYAYNRIYGHIMARAATTTDAFNAVAEPRRRQILDALAAGERPVNELVEALGLAQPQVSKHLRVLREVGVVRVREDGRRRLYRVNAPSLKPIHDWVKNYEHSWSERFDRLDTVLAELKKEEGDGRAN
jgi:DNA-binding transcriptional ArsR family regulator